MKFNEIAIPKGSRRIGPLDPDAQIVFTVVLSPKESLPSIHSAASLRKSSTPMHLTHDELRQKYGAIAGGVAAVESFARSHSLSVVEMATHRRSIQLCGRAEDVAKAFKTAFAEFELEGHRFYAPTIRPIAPRKWSGLIDYVLGLHSSHHSAPRRYSSLHGHATKDRLHDLARAYAFPADLDGAGQTIGLIELGGGFYPQDILAFCESLGIEAPRITVVSIGTGANQPVSRREIHEYLDVISGALHLAAGAEPSKPLVAAQCTAEVTMDIEILAALAPGAHIVVYFASADEQGLYHAIGHAVHDEHHRPDILSISWSVSEQLLSRSEVNAVEDILHEAAHLGITVCASSGDAGARNGSKDGTPSVNYPASSPNCLACGGTSGKMDKEGIPDEIVWNATHFGIKGATGGGVSQYFRLPAWQKGARVPQRLDGTAGRGVPDVAGLADPRFGCDLLISGRNFTSAGTSAVAPMWAALIARINQALGRRSGHLHRDLYGFASERKQVLRPILKGNNGLYRAGSGWSACVGYGTPKGDELLAALKEKNR